MRDRELARQLVDYVDATTAPVEAPASDERNLVMLEPERSNSTRWRWMIAAASIALVATMSVVAIVVATRDDEMPPTDDGRSTRASTGPVDTSGTTSVGPAVDQNVETLPGIETFEREQRAVSTVTDFFAAYGRGDVDAVLALLDPRTTDVSRQSEIVRWWSTIAANGDGVADWPSGRCAAVSSDEADPVVVECPVSIDDPVAIELGLDELTWTADAFDSGVVGQRFEPTTAALAPLTPVWDTYAEYLAEFRTDEYAADCEPSADGRMAGLDGISFTQACAELVTSVGEDAVRLRWAEGFWTAIAEGDRDAAIAFGDSTTTDSGRLSPFGWASTLEGQFDWWAAVGFEWTLDACRPLADGRDNVECDVTGQNAWSQALGVEPIPGTFIHRFGEDGILTVQDQFGGFIGLWGDRVFGVFAEWVEDNHPEDAAVMWGATGSVAEALELFEINTERFVAAQQDR